MNKSETFAGTTCKRFHLTVHFGWRCAWSVWGSDKSTHTRNRSPSMRLQMAFLAALMLWKDPRMCTLLCVEPAEDKQLCHTHTHLSASTILVLVTFSIVYLVLPPVPATLPMALERWPPFRGFTAEAGHTTPNTAHVPSLTSKDST